ncbi:MAG: type I methionyl aminopeptidase [Acidobacteria bacterium]|nr:type I methionyl aminopeptidase [Acidobacteriota bacterium]
MVVGLPSSDELEGVRAAGRCVAATIVEMHARLEPGVTTADLDRVGADFLAAAGAEPAPPTVGFPAATCVSVNDEAAHGIPGTRVIAAGDLVNIDVSASLNGFYADSGASFAVGDISGVRQRLLGATQRALDEALDRVKPGALLNSVGRAVQTVADETGFIVVRNLCGHGVGGGLHEEPRAILNYYEAGDRRRFAEGQVITVEPFLSTNSDRAIEGDDGWTLRTSLGGLVAQFEHTVVVAKNGVEILTSREAQ